MIENKYLLTFDFRILYCPNTKLALSCKELNLDTLEFTFYEGDLNILKYCYELKAENLERIVKKILNGEIGYELESKEMKWLETFELMLNENTEILTKDALVFNYLTLKLMLVGFSPEDSKNIVKTYFMYRNKSKDIPQIEIFIKNINKKIKHKKFWVCNDLYDEKELELKFIKTVCMYRKEMKLNFNFKMFKNDYLKICEKSIIPKMSKFNKIPSYLVKRPSTLIDQKSYLIEVYKSTIAGIIVYLLNNEMKHFQNEEIFINALIDEMVEVAKLYISMA